MESLFLNIDISKNLDILRFPPAYGSLLTVDL